jgi:diphthamide synthase (EF-2-diphthine--ammonia ligase)
LHVLRQQNEFEIVGLLTTVNQAFNRVAMHGTRVELLRAQATAAGLPLTILPLPWPCSNDIYESVMRNACSVALASGVEVIAFGDLFLRDVRAYREKQLLGSGLSPVFPLWEIPTHKLAAEMISAGLRARLTCIDPKVLPRTFAGREFDGVLLREMPAGADPCGENGEFHSFVYSGRMFSEPINIVTGEIVERDGFIYADMLSPVVSTTP